MTVFECLVEECHSTKIAAVALARQEKDWAEIENIMSEEAEREQRQRKKDMKLFAKKYFRKRRVIWPDPRIFVNAAPLLSIPKRPVGKKTREANWAISKIILDPKEIPKEDGEGDDPNDSASESLTDQSDYSDDLSDDSAALSLSAHTSPDEKHEVVKVSLMSRTY